MPSWSVTSLQFIALFIYVFIYLFIYFICTQGELGSLVRLVACELELRCLYYGNSLFACEGKVHRLSLGPTKLEPRALGQQTFGKFYFLMDQLDSS